MPMKVSPDSLQFYTKYGVEIRKYHNTIGSNSQTLSNVGDCTKLVGAVQLKGAFLFFPPRPSSPRPRRLMIFYFLFGQ